MENISRAAQFNSMKPSLVLKDGAIAKRDNKLMLSFDHKFHTSVRGEPGAYVAEKALIIVKFALADGTTGTIILDEVAGRALHAAVEEANAVDWIFPLDPWL
jgi:hypothetical protein